MAAHNDTASMALFCDFENIALGVRDAQYEKFDIRPVLERLLAKGSIVVKKAYCDWERYKGFKAAMHEANFELIEIPHVRQSGKNSADIRMVVDALDLCYTKAHVDTFVIISGDSDFSPLVSKLRENAKRVIGVGVKQSCSDLLITNCDEFIYYDDLVRDRDGERVAQRREREKRSPEEEQKRREKIAERQTRAVELAAATLADMMADRGEADRVWASVLKEVIKRRNPGFNENYFGFRTFGNLLEEAASRGLIAVGRDDKSGTYVMRAQPRLADEEAVARAIPDGAEEAGTPSAEALPPAAEVAPEGNSGSRRRNRGGRGRDRERDRPARHAETPIVEATADQTPLVVVVPAAIETVAAAVPAPSSPAAVELPAEAPVKKATRSRGGAGAGRGRKSGVTPAAEMLPADAAPPAAAPLAVGAAAPAATETVPVPATEGKKPARGRKSAKAEPAPAAEDAAKPAKAPSRAPRSRKTAKTGETA